MPALSSSGIRSRPSARSVDDTVATLKGLFEQRNIKLFVIVDHSGEAAKVGITMPPTKLLIFGNPKAGTPIMLVSPDSAIDLPLKLLFAQDALGNTIISYNDPRYLEERHHLLPELVHTLSAVEALADLAAT